jgi:hypothetical protein
MDIQMWQVQLPMIFVKWTERKSLGTFGKDNDNTFFLISYAPVWQLFAWTLIVVTTSCFEAIFFQPPSEEGVLSCRFAIGDFLKLSRTNKHFLMSKG